MNSIDERILELLNTTSVLEWLKNDNSKLKKAAFKNYHWVLIKNWLIAVGILIVGGSIALLTSLIGLTPVSQADLTLVDNLAKTLIAPSITMNGLFITFTPVITFFFLSEIKEMEKESKENLEEIKKEIGEEKEAINEYDNRVKYDHAFFYNFRSGILKYVRTYITIAIGSLLFLFMAYALLSPPLFLIADIIVLSLLFTGVFPIISIALYKPVLTLITFNLKDGKKEIITYDD